MIALDPEKMVADLEAQIGKEEADRLLDAAAAALSQTKGERDLSADLDDYIEYELGQQR